VCSNNYTYAFGDPINQPDLSGEGGCHKKHHGGWLHTLGRVAGYVGVGAAFVGVTIATGGADVPVFVGAIGLGAAAVSTGAACAAFQDERCVYSAATTLGSALTFGIGRAAAGAGEEFVGWSARALGLTFSAVRVLTPKFCGR